MPNYCGNCMYFDWGDKCSIGYRCTCENVSNRRFSTASWYYPPSRRGCSWWCEDRSKHYIPKSSKKGAKKGMHHYFVVFVGIDKGNKFIIKNDSVWFNESELSMDDIREIQECIGSRHKLKSCAIINIIKIRK